jgi:hypothetical protein
MILASYKIKCINKFGIQISWLSGAAVCDRPQWHEAVDGLELLGIRSDGGILLKRYCHFGFHKYRE